MGVMFPCADSFDLRSSVNHSVLRFIPLNIWVLSCEYFRLKIAVHVQNDEVYRNLRAN